MKTQPLMQARQSIEAKKAAIAALESTLRSPIEVRSIVVDYVARAAERATAVLGHRVAALSDGGHVGELLLPPQQGSDMAGMLAALVGPERILAVLEPHLAALPAAPGAHDRSASLRTLRAELFELEVREEALVCEAEDRGEDVTRRADADPAAVLWLPESQEA